MKKDNWLRRFLRWLSRRLALEKPMDEMTEEEKKDEVWWRSIK